ncbi:MAG: Abi-like protein [Firmicutes bacterium ADurb.Bin182]|nr:MAG: Abi-like protein [Firmicutes bacterium ADurb.Bin182]
MAEKVFKTYRQLITILRRRGLKIKTGSGGSRAIRIFEKENFYNVINGYKDLFIDITSSAEDEKYKPNTDFNEVFALYSFDREIRIIFLKYLLQIENEFKSVLSHHFSEKYGYDNYLRLENFCYTASTEPRILKDVAKRHKLDYPHDIEEIKRISAAENAACVTKLFGEIQQVIARQLNKHNPMVSHYMTKYGYIPLWVLVNVLTFGKVATFFLHMKEIDKVNVARHFKLPYRELHKYMSMLGYARNKCAHDERFYDIRFTSRLHTKSIPYFSLIGLPTDKSGSCYMGTNDCFAIAIIFKQILSKSDFKEFVSAIDRAFKKLSSQLKTITIENVQRKMGYPSNWTNLVRL